MATDAPSAALPMPADTAVVARADVAWAVAGNEAVVRVPATGSTHALDPSAALLWQCLDGTSPLRLVFADLAEAFGADPTLVAADCLPVLASWIDAGIAIEVADPTAAPAPLPAEPVLRTWRRLVDPPNS